MLQNTCFLNLKIVVFSSLALRCSIFVVRNFWMPLPGQFCVFPPFIYLHLLWIAFSWSVSCFSTSLTCIWFVLPFPGLFCAFPPLLLATAVYWLFLVQFVPFHILYSICIWYGLPFLVSSMPFQLFYFHLLALPFLGPFCDCTPLILASDLDCLFLVRSVLFHLFCLYFKLPVPGTVLFHLLYLHLLWIAFSWSVSCLSTSSIVFATALDCLFLICSVLFHLLQLHLH